MQALALCTAAAPARGAAFRAAAPSGRTLRLTVCNVGPGSPSTTPRPPGPRTGPPRTGPPRTGGGPGGGGGRPAPGGGRPGGSGPRPAGPPGQQQRRPGGNTGSSSGSSFPPRQGPGGGYRERDGASFPPRQGPGGGYRERDGQRGGMRGGRQYRERDAGVTMNEAIRAPEVRVLAEDRTPLGVMDTRDALAEARALGVDMILVVADAAPPVVRLMELSKYQYELIKAAKEQKKKQRDAVVETKELKLRPATDVHDYQVKVKAAQKFLSKGHRVKLTLQFRGREMEFQQIGREMFQRFVEDCGPDVAIEQAPAMQGRQMSMVLGPAKKEL